MATTSTAVSHSGNTAQTCTPSMAMVNTEKVQVNNIKQKAILMLAYSAGLRVSEVIRLRPQDIDTKRNMIYIKAAKGRKDRYTVLSVYEIPNPAKR
ncbi:hypothetical protein HKBW3S44_01412 [Candidatus Hakubella thermalkaliphila]|uniref:Tyr recombinase domain-containing protein n=1 Tax=Candidatus Hakubella thermalkaliphila TaxID=2754717 RepID=A0A6V8Q4I5_9ACTN|nr:tyrosine-type recombinase/integrase [Candidatus Hakubella thermalkaliphila]MBT9170518.1 Tyrosine recombinase XerC [Actinomycetota bacterium]GFP37735.1 hypothetical protein HKBW3S44_01412 [Candidatus Hakubella thermalkaliphila]GFP39682.1 hypothetical protein HKBW3S47_01380 [Candidatus Hakubella thermalkaliphila]GFP41388.1 hypothetical protein HKBW3C_00514 [Candidatus Hakubella thermalkaliphila]